MAIFLVKERGFAKAKTGEGQTYSNGQPNEMNPPRWRQRLIEQDSADCQYPPDNQDQERGRAVTDIECAEIKFTGSAGGREAGETRE